MEWKPGRTVFRERRSRGAPVKVAAAVAANALRWWHNSALLLISALPRRRWDQEWVPRPCL